MTTQLQDRIIGATLPNTVLTFTDEGAVIDPSAGYTWSVEASTAADLATKLWTKTTGFTASSTTLTIAWAVGDLGALPKGQFVLEVTGTHAGGLRKAQLRLNVTPTIP